MKTAEDLDFFKCILNLLVIKIKRVNFNNGEIKWYKDQIYNYHKYQSNHQVHKYRMNKKIIFKIIMF